MTHTLIVGQTLSGKTGYAKMLCNWWLSRGVGAVVQDPMNDPDWNKNGSNLFRIFSDPLEFLAFVKDPDECQQCVIFVDEAGMSLNKYAEEFNWLTCQSRHHGHRAHIIANRAEMVSKSIRSQCATLVAFNLNPDDAKQYSRDFNSVAVLDAPNLKQGEFIKVTRFQDPQRGRLWK